MSTFDQTRPPKRSTGIFYGWWIVGVSFLVWGLSFGSIWGAVGVWFKTLELHFGWTRTQLTGAFALAQLEGSIMGPLAGYFIDRLGPRRMVLIGLPLVGAGFIILSRTSNLALFYLAFAVFTIGAAAGTWLPTLAALNRWFNRNKSTVIAISGEGSYLGGLVLVPALAWAVSPDQFGWQTTALGIGVLFLVLAMPVSRVIRNRPEDYGELPDGDPSPAPSALLTVASPARADAPATVDTPGLTARQAMRMSAFWYLTFGHALSGMVNQTLTVHLVPMLTDQGISLQAAAYIWSVIMGTGMVSSLVAGYLGDRVPKNVALFVFVAIQMGAFALAAMVQSVPMAIVSAALYGIGFGGRTTLTVAIRGEYFGPRAFATITGISMAPMFVLQLVAPLFAAAMFDIRQSYVLPFAILTALGVPGAVLFLVARRPVLPSTGQSPGQARAVARG